MEGAVCGFAAVVGVAVYLGVIEAVGDQERHLGCEVAGCYVLAIAGGAAGETVSGAVT